MLGLILGYFYFSYFVFYIKLKTSLVLRTVLLIYLLKKKVFSMSVSGTKSYYKIKFLPKRYNFKLAEIFKSSWFYKVKKAIVSLKFGWKQFLQIYKN